MNQQDRCPSGYGIRYRISAALRAISYRAEDLPSRRHPLEPDLSRPGRRSQTDIEHGFSPHIGVISRTYKPTGSGCDGFRSLCFNGSCVYSVRQFRSKRTTVSFQQAEGTRLWTYQERWEGQYSPSTLNERSNQIVFREEAQPQELSPQRQAVLLPPVQ
jgi:hypothetical protein